jgi:hypothetical protein
VLADVIAKVTTREQVHDKVQIFSVLESVVHVHYKRIVQLCEDLSLIHHRFYAALSDDTCLRHFLHSVGLLGLLAFYFPYLAEAALTDAVQIVEVSLSESYTLKVKGSNVFSLRHIIKILYLPATFSVSNSCLK